MTDRWDDFSKSLAEGSSTRRDSLRLLGAALAGAVLSPLGLGTARGAGKSQAADPCKTICRCSNKRQQDACLAACRSCTGATSRLCGSCGTGVNCYDLAHDVHNCGACGNACLPGPYETAACINGGCAYQCVDGAVRCNGTCTFLDSDPNNCGACGNVCPGFAPYCNQGACSACAPGTVLCGNACVNTYSDPNNCGACGNVCGEATPYCSGGECTDCPPGSAICSGACIDVMWDGNNCGGCGITCQPLEFCSWGLCQGIG
jgi:hypothetical protein